MAPIHYLQEHIFQILARFSQMVCVADWLVLIDFPPHQSPFNQFLQPLRQQVCRNALCAALQSLERALLMPDEVADDQQCPLVSDQFK